GSPSDLGKEGLNAPHLLRTQPEVSCIALVHSRRESVNLLACKPNLWGLTLGQDQQRDVALHQPIPNGDVGIG
ncbi:MAG: hypothetical protein MEQ74_13110, partial [Paracoccus sp.]|nr:hypothetical protein [Paracoccus sp. (in: a-proteobacteria)]